jgi:hypothetical protein
MVDQARADGGAAAERAADVDRLAVLPQRVDARLLGGGGDQDCREGKELRAGRHAVAFYSAR